MNPADYFRNELAAMLRAMAELELGPAELTQLAQNPKNLEPEELAKAFEDYRSKVIQAKILWFRLRGSMNRVPDPGPGEIQDFIEGIWKHPTFERFKLINNWYRQRSDSHRAWKRGYESQPDQVSKAKVRRQRRLAKRIGS